VRCTREPSPRQPPRELTHGSVGFAALWPAAALVADASRLAACAIALAGAYGLLPSDAQRAVDDGVDFAVRLAGRLCKRTWRAVVSPLVTGVQRAWGALHTSVVAPLAPLARRMLALSPVPVALAVVRALASATAHGAGDTTPSSVAWVLASIYAPALAALFAGSAVAWKYEDLAPPRLRTANLLASPLASLATTAAGVAHFLPAIVRAAAHAGELVEEASTASPTQDLHALAQLSLACALSALCAACSCGLCWAAARRDERLAGLASRAWQVAELGLKLAVVLVGPRLIAGPLWSVARMLASAQARPERGAMTAYAVARGALTSAAGARATALCVRSLRQQVARLDALLAASERVAMRAAKVAVQPVAAALAFATSRVEGSQGIALAGFGLGVGVLGASENAPAWAAVGAVALLRGLAGMGRQWPRRFGVFARLWALAWAAGRRAQRALQPAVMALTAWTLARAAWTQQSAPPHAAAFAVAAVHVLAAAVWWAALEAGWPRAQRAAETVDAALHALPRAAESAAARVFAHLAGALAVAAAWVLRPLTHLARVAAPLLLAAWDEPRIGLAASLVALAAALQLFRSGWDVAAYAAVVGSLRAVAATLSSVLGAVAAATATAASRELAAAWDDVVRASLLESRALAWALALFAVHGPVTLRASAAPQLRPFTFAAGAVVLFPELSRSAALVGAAWAVLAAVVRAVEDRRVSEARRAWRAFNERPDARAPADAVAEALAGLPDASAVERRFDEGAECAICKDAGDQDEAQQLLLCGHSFHRACIGQWVVVHPSCPLCRRPVSRAHGVLNELVL